MRGLYRNSEDAWIAGVCGGLANHFQIDPSIIRVLMTLFCLAGWGLILYAVLWIVLPSKPLGAFSGKRFYRDMDNKAIAGVASGIARYFNWDIRIVRLALIAPLALSLIFSLSWPFLIPGAWLWNFVFQGSFVGTLVFAYFLLWIILPASHADDTASVSEPSPQTEKTQEAPPQTRRVSASIGEPLGVILRVFLFFFAGILIFALFVALIAALFAGAFLWPLNNYIWTSTSQQYYALGTLILFLGVPIIGFIVWLMRRVMGVKSGSWALRGAFAGLWLLGVACLVLLVISLASDFRYYDHSAPITIAVATQPKTRMRVVVTEPSLNAPHAWWSDDEGFNWDYSEDILELPFVRIKAVQSPDSFYHVTLVKYSAGKSKDDVLKRASDIHYEARYKDGILDLGSGFSIDATSKYRLQNIVVEISIPTGKLISFDKSVTDKLSGIQVQIINGQRWGRNDINIKQAEFAWKTEIDYVMTPEGILKEASYQE